MDTISFRFCYNAGRSLSWSAERAGDGSPIDFGPAAFVAPGSTLAAPTSPMIAETGIFTGRYHGGLDLPAGTLVDGSQLVVAIHDLTDPANPRCLGEGVLECVNGGTTQDFSTF